MSGQAQAFGGFSVDDLGEARRFCGGTLGLRVEETGQGDMRMLTLTLGSGAQVLVHPEETHTPATFTALGFPVDGIGAAVAELERRGVTLERCAGFDHDEKGVVRAGGDGPAAIGWFTGPAGNVLSVLRGNRPRAVERYGADRPGLGTSFRGRGHRGVRWHGRVTAPPSPAGGAEGDPPPGSAGTAPAGRGTAPARRGTAAGGGTAPAGRRAAPAGRRAAGALARRTSARVRCPPGRMGEGAAGVMRRRSAVRTGPGRPRATAGPGTRAVRGRPHAQIVPGPAPRPAHRPGDHRDERQYAPAHQHERDRHDVPLPPGPCTDCPQDAPRPGGPKRLLSKSRASTQPPAARTAGSARA
ncbi:hypothetical protein SGRIM128S_06977 [Streptomyces griseomycini]